MLFGFSLNLGDLCVGTPLDLRGLNLA